MFIIFHRQLLNQRRIPKKCRTQNVHYSHKWSWQQVILDVSIDLNNTNVMKRLCFHI